MLTKLLEIIGIIALLIVCAFLAYVLGLTVVYIFKALKKEVKKGGGKNDNDPKP